MVETIHPCIRPVDGSPAKGSQLPKATLGASFPHNRFSQRGSALWNRLLNNFPSKFIYAIEV
ncbi:hypothetical protein DRN44_06335 [Thermococci archaeon]|nr:MAG: hypothetical protein DRN44_06335 [Thermococci archaeon]